MSVAQRSAVLLVALLALAGCGSMGDLFSASRPPPRDVPSAPPSDPPASEARICQLARQAVREAMGVAELRGDSCTASHLRPGEWQAQVAFMSGSQQQSYRLDLRPNRQRQDWAVMDITPLTPSG